MNTSNNTLNVTPATRTGFSTSTVARSTGQSMQIAPSQSARSTGSVVRTTPNQTNTFCIRPVRNADRRFATLDQAAGNSMSAGHTGGSIEIAAARTGGVSASRFSTSGSNLTVNRTGVIATCTAHAASDDAGVNDNGSNHAAPAPATFRIGARAFGLAA